ncbi:hypothetical protein [Bradyrhizobium genosp. P]|uniref:hypothetical protein n=1 Tax=Bradyrhizobium genosp. P TaxID=83641 RepID=UPI003CF1FDD3
MKVDTFAKVMSERANIALCTDTIPFPFMPPMIPQRYTPGAARSALVSHFVDRAILLSDYAHFHNLNRVVLSIFDDALRVWRSRPAVKSYRLANMFWGQPASSRTIHSSIWRLTSVLSAPSVFQSLKTCSTSCAGCPSWRYMMCARTAICI